MYAPVFRRKAPLVRATFIARPNRFLAIARLEEPSGDIPVGAEVRCHVADPGRLRELLIPGVGVRLLEAGAADSLRRTAFDLVLVEHEGITVSIDSRVPNKLMRAALEGGAFPELSAGRHVQPEYTWGSSRFDFRLWADGEPDCLVEVKSGTLVVNGMAMFPDAPTLRGARHVRELAEAVGDGLSAAVVFVIQRPDAWCFRPHAEMDPHFARALRGAAAAGVQVKAVRCDVSEDEISIAGEIEVVLAEWEV